jgi:glucose/arabinose dehydrogenase
VRHPALPVRISIVCAALLWLGVSPVVAQLRATLVASGFSGPLAFVQDPSDVNVQVVVEQRGRVRVLRNGVVGPADFLDLTGQITSGGERGLLGLAFAPDYATSGRVFVCFTNRDGDTVVARFTRSATDPLRVDPSSRFDLAWPGGARVIPQPFSNHNGGHLAFGPDGYLYVGLGDGGSANDPMNHAQNPASLLGKLLRLDVNVPDGNTNGYVIPPTNPFVGRSDVWWEIWALGLRNPWRWNFDDARRGGTGAIVIADVGQGRWEEVNYQPANAGARNYGWRNREGAHDNVTTVAPTLGPLRDPIWEYGHGDGRSITGGFVYRGTALGTAFVGRYFFADFVRSRVWSLALTIDHATREAMAGGLLEHTAELGAGATSPSSFGVDAKGELYVVNYNGTVHRIEGPPGQVPAPDPTTPPPDVTPGPRSRVGESLGRARPRQ